VSNYDKNSELASQAPQKVVKERLKKDEFSDDCRKLVGTTQKLDAVASIKTELHMRTPWH